MTYQHTQRGPLGSLLVIIAIAFAIAAWILRQEFTAAIALWVAAGIFVVLSQMMQNLTIKNSGDFLQVQFGNIPAFQHKIRYSEITTVEVAKSSWIDGWGIHWVPGRGTTWNLWGFDCVKLTVNGKIVRLGTDDAEQLAAFIQQQIASRSQ